MIKLVLFIFFLFNHIDNYIVLPIKTFSKENYFPFNESDSLKNEIFEEYYSSLYTELDIGTKTQKIPLLIEVKTNDFLITSIHSIENASDYYLNKAIYDYSQNFQKIMIILMKINQAQYLANIAKIEKNIKKKPQSLKYLVQQKIFFIFMKI